MMVWSIDADSEDWIPATEGALIQRTVERLEKAGKGILLMHDIQPITPRIMSRLLAELKAHNFQIVHVVLNQETKTAEQGSPAR
jgi:peptidoglycan/xylan/chitin deacetylase (PgdA/CDA1 family)